MIRSRRRRDRLRPDRAFYPRLEWNEDRTLLSTFLVTTTSFGGPGSIRQAIVASNAATGQTNTIQFDIPGDGVQTIQVLSSLPQITNPVLIDGFSQPGYAGTPLIEINGSQAGDSDGLTIIGSGVTIRGLVVDGFQSYTRGGIHISGSGATGNWIYGNFLGTDPTGTQAEPNYAGVLIDDGASGNIIGTNGDGVGDAAEGNLISGNGDSGISITGQDSSGNVTAQPEQNVIAGNLIGTDVTGALPLGNAGWGVALQAASSNWIGVVPRIGFADAIAGNVIASNSWYYGVIYGAGVYIVSGDGNVVAANAIGTDATGTLSLPNDGGGIEIDQHSSDNTIGGTAAGAGNLITHNNGPGIFVLGDDSAGNRLSANRIFANGLIPTPTPQGSLGFEEYSFRHVALPNDLLRKFEQNETIEAWFRTTVGGVILGVQDMPADPNRNPYNWAPVLYVGSDGVLYGELSNGDIDPISSSVTVNDGLWHHAALVVDAASQTESLYLDGQWLGSLDGPVEDIGASYNQIGLGYDWQWPGGMGGWDSFDGQIDDVRIWSVARSADEIQQDMTTAAIGTEPGLEAYYRFDDARGLTAHDSTPNQRDGTLAGAPFGGPIPLWANGGMAIDLGQDGTTFNSPSPRQGPNDLRNAPTVVTGADGRFRGWLGGSAPDTSYHLEFFASSSSGPGGTGEAEDYLGSIEVTTDDQGQAVFDVPFTPPADQSFVTATATDPDGNTSEVSPLRRGIVVAPTGFVRLDPGQPLDFSAESGDGIALQAPDDGPFDPTWNLTISVPAGTLTLSTTAGLAGSGDGTGTLEYSGTIAALNAALEGLVYTPVPDGPDTASLSLDARSDGALPVQAQVKITDGTFTVTTTDDGGPGSLRQAILDADATLGPATIAFDLPVPEVATIVPTSPLPPITNAILVDGFSQPGYAGTPLIELNGSQVGAGDGLTITGSGATVRGLMIDGFSEGAGILITGAGATGDRVDGNVIGTDPAGSQAQPNRYGVRLVAGAHDNLIGTEAGGSSGADEANIISGNARSGVEVGSDSFDLIGGLFTLNGSAAIHDSRLRLTDGSYEVASAFTSEPIDVTRFTTHFRFQLTRPLGDGITFTIQGSGPDSLGSSDDGLGYQGIGKSIAVKFDVSGASISTDDDSTGLYVDGAIPTTAGAIDLRSSGIVLRSDHVFEVAMSYDGTTLAVTITDTQTGASASQTYSVDIPGMVGGPTAYVGFTGSASDYTATLDILDWTTSSLAIDAGAIDNRITGNRIFANGGPAIDLGDEGLTANAASPRQGPNNLQNFPIIVGTTGGLQGWLSGGAPKASYTIDIFASSVSRPSGSGEAEYDLGSLEVTTDGQGQAVFAVPFTPPADEPLVTATATDTQGNTSEVSVLRSAMLRVPASDIRLVPGRPTVLSAGSGDGIALLDPDAGPLDPAWDLTLSVPVGTLSLSTTDGLVGAGDGTGTLHYLGALSTLNAALDGLSFVLPSGFHGLATMSLDARSDGASPVHAQVLITDGVLVVTTTADSGLGSLRQAILDSDDIGDGGNTIDFAIPGAGIQSIALGSPLPPITSAVLIDGLSQPGYSGSPLIAVSGSLAGKTAGLTITGSGVAIRGLDIRGFAAGAGILITGPAASNNVISSNVIGTDPAGSVAQPNQDGVRIEGGAHDNTVGGNTAASGNLVAWNRGSGVVVTGDASLGNRITANRIFANEAILTPTPASALVYHALSYVSLPNDLIRGFEQAETIEVWFQTTNGGVILGYQTTNLSSSDKPSASVPALYVGRDGKVYGELWDGRVNPIRSNRSVNDGLWHHVALVADGAAGTQSLYLDGVLVGTLAGPVQDIKASFNQIGRGVGDSWPAGVGYFNSFDGSIDDVRIWSVVRSAGEVQQDMTTAQSGTEPGLEAYYRFDEGQGLIAQDATPNHRDGTLMGGYVYSPTWANGGQAIDLGGDGITPNANLARQGPDKLQNYPVIATTADGTLEGWFHDSRPRTTFHLEFFASADYSPGGSGEAQVYLGSLEVSTDDRGQAVFTVPFTPPADEPFVTATATDSLGNTSEVSALRNATWQMPEHAMGVVPGTPLTLAAAAGDGLALKDPDAGPLDPIWDLTLSVPGGTLRLSESTGLTGTGDGTGTLHYRGWLSSLNQALDGLILTEPPSFQDTTTLSLLATSSGAASVRAQLLVYDRIFAVTTTADTGPGALRQAILDANGAPGDATITFAIPGGGVHSIAPASPLPPITNTVLIDGWSQPGFGGTPLIELGTQPAGSFNTLMIVGAQATVRGLTNSGFASSGIDSYQIETTTDERVAASVHAEGGITRLFLLDAQGRTLMQSDGQSSGAHDDLIDLTLPAGFFSLEVLDLGGAGTYSLTTRFLPSSAPYQPVSLPSYLRSLVIGDFNGDGLVDLAAADTGNLPGGTLGEVGVLLGNGDGTFQPSRRYAAGVNPGALVTGDFNGDGRADLATVNQGSSDVSVLLGEGDGTFDPAVGYKVGSDPAAIVTGDFNGDGWLDLATVNQGSNDGSVLLGEGDGTFQAGGHFAVGLYPTSIVAYDFDGDGRLDLLAFATDGPVILLGHGDGTFVPASRSETGRYSAPSMMGDLNGDGRTDRATLNASSNGVLVALGNGDGTFQSPVAYAVASGASFLISGDFNGDGRTDLAAYSGSGNVSFLLGDGNGSFQQSVQYATGSGTSFFVMGDFNGDGRTDQATGNGGSKDVSVRLGNGDGTFQQDPQYKVGTRPQSLVTGDFNGDGRTDLATANSGSGDISVLLGNGDGTFQGQVRYAAGSSAGSLVKGDFNGDGRTDLAVTSSYLDNTVSVLLGNGDGTFQPPVPYAVAREPMALVTGDFNGDGWLDLAVAGNLVTDIYNINDHNTVSVLLGNGDGTFRPAARYAVGSSGVSIVAGDFNGDGRTDLVVGISNYQFSLLSGSAIAVLMGNGDGTFQPGGQYSLGQYPSGLVAAGDFNGDGELDLAVPGANINELVLRVLLGNGDGTFQKPMRYAQTAWPGRLLAGDFNGDGLIDLAMTVSSVTSDQSVGVQMLPGNGDGTFQPPVQYTLGSTPSYLVSADFNGDGRPDLATANSGSNDVSVLLNLAGNLEAPGSADTVPHANPLIADVNGDRTADAMVIDPRGAILYRQGRPGQSGAFDPPVTINPVDPATGAVEYPSRDIAWVPNSAQGPLLVSVDATGNAVSLFAWREGDFRRIGSLATGLLPSQIVSSDLNNDDWNDLIVRNAGDGTLSIFFNNGSGSSGSRLDPFLPPVTLNVGPAVSDVAVAKVDQDGVRDLLVTDKLIGEVGVIRGLGGGAFAPPSWYRAGSGLYGVTSSGDGATIASLEATAGVAAGRFVTGGPASLVTINPGSNTLALLAGLGSGRFANPVAIPTQSPARVIRVEDFDGNGIPDLAVLIDDGLDVYLGDGHDGFGPPTHYDAGPDPTGLNIADANQDGRLDLLVGDSYGDLLLLLGKGDGTFAPYHKADQAVALAVADLTGDGKPDFIFADQGLDRVVVDYGDQTAVLADRSSGLLSPGAVKLADLNGDGIADLVVANSGSNNILVYPGLGDGQFGPALNGGHGFFTGTNPTGFTVADVNGDGIPDLLVANTGSNDVSVLFGQGSGSSWTLTPGPRIKTDGGPSAVVVGNILNDGHPDLAVANSQANDVQVFPGVGSGFFNDQPQAVRTFAVGQAPGGLFLGQFNGTTGLAALDSGSSAVTLISSPAAASPLIQNFSSGGQGPVAGFAGDFNGDGFTDLVVANSSGSFGLLLGGDSGLGLSQSLTSTAVPSPTSVSFTGLEDGVLSFYASTAGREAALSLAFELGAESISTGIATSPGAEPESAVGALPGAGLAFGPIVDVGTILAVATAGAYQQVAQLVGLSGSALDLIAPLFTVSMITPELESEATGSMGVELLANFQPGVGLGTTLGQAQSPDDSDAEGRTTDEPQATQEPARAAPGEEKAAPRWAREAMGLDDAWDRVRADLLEKEGAAGVGGHRRDPSPPAPGPARRDRKGPSATSDTPSRSPADPGADQATVGPLPDQHDSATESRSSRATDLIDAAVRALAVEEMDGRGGADLAVKRTLPGLDRWMRPVGATVMTTASMAVLAWTARRVWQRPPGSPLGRKRVRYW